MRISSPNRNSALRLASALLLMLLLSVPAAATDCWKCGVSAPMPDKCHQAPPSPHPCCSDSPHQKQDCRHDPQWAIKAAWKPVPHPQNSSRSNPGSRSEDGDDWGELQRSDRERALPIINSPPRPGQQSAGLYSLFAVLRI